jgi:hypothetical protein
MSSVAVEQEEVVSKDKFRSHGRNYYKVRKENSTAF